MINVIRLVKFAVAAWLIPFPVVYAQDVEWIRQFGTARDDVGRAVSADGLGSVYVGGDISHSFATGGPGNAFVSRYTSDGTLLWTRELNLANVNHSGYGVAADGLGNVVLAGKYSSTAAFLRKYNDAGDVLWTRTININAPNSHAAVAADDLGNVYITGSTRANIGGALFGFDDIYVRKYDAAGNQQWTRTFGTSSFDSGESITTDHLGNVYIGASTEGSLAATGQSWDAVVIKLDSAGVHQWSRQLGSSGIEGGPGISVDGSGNVYLGGRTDGSLGGPSAGSYDAYVAKYDSAGTLQWTRQFGTDAYDQASSVWADKGGRVYVAGDTHGSLGDASTGSSDAFVRGFEPDGDVLWTTQLGSTAFDSLLGISGDATAIYSAGYTTGVLGAGSAGGTDAIVIKIPVPEPSSAQLLLIASVVLFSRSSMLPGIRC